MTDLMGAVADATADAVRRIYPINGTDFARDENGKLQAKYPYSTFSATLGRGDSYTLDAREGLRHGRVVVQTFSRAATTALADAEAIRAELIGTALQVDGYDTTPCRAELDPTVVRDPDDTGVVAVTATYTFTAIKEA